MSSSSSPPPSSPPPPSSITDHPASPSSSKDEDAAAAAATGGGHDQQQHDAATKAMVGLGSLSISKKILLVPGSTMQASTAHRLEEEDEEEEGDVEEEQNADGQGNGRDSTAPTSPPKRPTLQPERHSWGRGTATEFHVRATNYKKSKKKEPSLDAFYELVSFDLVTTPEGSVDHVARYMGLSALKAAGGKKKRLFTGFPSLFIVNCQLPDGEPTMFQAAEDGPGRSAIFVFALKESTVNMLEGEREEGGKKQELPPALRLLREWFQRAPTDPDIRSRFKVREQVCLCVCVCACEFRDEEDQASHTHIHAHTHTQVIASCRNIEALELPSFITNYNGKPVIISKSGSLHQGEEEGDCYMEMDIRV